MKIVHISLYGPVTDGWNYQDNMIPKFQIQNGNEVTIIASKWVFNTEGNITYYDKTHYTFQGINMIRLDLKVGKDIYSKIKVYEGLLGELEKIKPDCIFVHGVQFVDIHTIVKYARQYHVDIYVDNHCDFSNSATNWLSKYVLHGIIWKHFAKEILPYTKKFYGVLPARVDFLINMYGIPSNKVELLVMGADDDKVDQVLKGNSKERIRKKYNIGKDDFLVMFGGKIDAWKKQTLLLMEAIGKIENPKVKLIVFGSVTQELADNVKDLCIKNKVQYIGWVKAEESYEYFAAADLAIFSGRHSVFWEQVAGMGIPMVCKYWEGTTHVDCGGNVKFLYRDSVEEIKSTIENIAYDRSVYDAMKCAAEKAQKLFSYREISRKCIE